MSDAGESGLMSAASTRASLGQKENPPKEMKWPWSPDMTYEESIMMVVSVCDKLKQRRGDAEPTGETKALPALSKQENTDQKDQETAAVHEDTVEHKTSGDATFAEEELAAEAEESAPGAVSQLALESSSLGEAAAAENQDFSYDSDDSSSVEIEEEEEEEGLDPVLSEAHLKNEKEPTPTPCRSLLEKS